MYMYSPNMVSIDIKNMVNDQIMAHNVHPAGSTDKLYRLKTPKHTSNEHSSKLDGNTKKGSQRKRKPVVIPTNSEQLEKLERAARFMTKRPSRVSEKKRRRIEREWLEGLTSRDRHSLHVMNPWAGELWSGLLHQAYERFQAAEPHFAVTVLDHDWDLLVNDYTHFDPAELRSVIQTIRQQLQTAFRGTSYLFMVDVSVEREAGLHNNARRLCLHLHGIVWRDRRKLRAAKRHFAGGHYGAPALKTKLMYDPAGWFNYMSRDQRLGNHWYRERATWERLYKRRNEDLYSGQRQHLLRLFRHVTKPDLCLASGLGKQIKLDALRNAKARGYVTPDRGSDWSVELPDAGLWLLPLDAPELDPYYDD